MAATPTKAALDKARKAGRSLLKVDWDAVPDGLEVVDAIHRTPGVHHCPFDKRDQPEEFEAWVEGLREAVAAPQKSPDEILAELDDALGKTKGGSK